MQSPNIHQESIYLQTMKLIKNFRLIEAENSLNQIISASSTSYIAYFQLGYIRQIQGRMDIAKEMYKKALSVNPNYATAIQHLAKLKEINSLIKNFKPNNDAIYVYYYNQFNNWGDVLNSVIVKHLSGQEIIWASPFDYRIPIKHTVIGSVLHSIDANTIVWGTGAMSANLIPAVKPASICAVRGPLTRELLIGRGIDCPEIYGDPALLYPKFFNPDVKKEFDLGIIAHYVDQQHPWLEYARSCGAKIINIRGGVKQVIDDIKSCDRIASSSLHGIIAADAYGIPSIWIELSDKVQGDGFKFRDYYLSVNRPIQKPVQITADTTIQQIDEGFKDYKIDIDLDRLLESCPFTRH